MIGSSIALSISDILTVLQVVLVGRVNGEFIINPTEQQATEKTLHLVVSVTKDGL